MSNYNQWVVKRNYLYHYKNIRTKFNINFLCTYYDKFVILSSEVAKKLSIEQKVEHIAEAVLFEDHLLKRICHTSGDQFIVT